MEITDADTGFLHIVGQILCHPFGQSRDEHFVMIFYFLAHLSQQIVDLSLHRTDIYLRVQQTGRPDDLFRTKQFVLRFIFPGSGGYKHDLVDPVLKLLKIQRPVILGGRQTESIIHQGCFPRLISGIHPADLRNRFVGLVDDHQKIIAEVINQGIGRLPRFQPGKIPGVVFDTGTYTGFPEHFDVKVGPLFDPLRFQKLSFALKISDTFLHVLLDFLRCLQDRIHRNDVVGRREDRDVLQLAEDFTGQRIDLGDPVDLVAKKFHPNGFFAFLRREDFQHIAAHTESSPVEIHVIAIILNIDQGLDDIVPVFFHSRPQRDDHFHIILRTSDSINTGHAGDHDHIPALGECRGRRQTELVDLFING